MKRPLPIPPETKGDNRATEMIRVWLAHKDLHVSLNLGIFRGKKSASARPDLYAIDNRDYGDDAVTIEPQAADRA